MKPGRVAEHVGRSRHAAVVISALAACVLAAPADALVKRSDGGEKVGAGQWLATAQCRQDERVVSGGYATAPGASITENRAKCRREWAVRSTDDLRAFALCSRRLDVSRVAAQVAMSPETTGTLAEATCRRGDRIVSGGFRYANPVADSPVFKSKPTGRRTWSVLAHDPGGAALTAYAYCLSAGPGLEVRTNSKSIASKETARSQVACRRREELLGGGWSVRPRPNWNNLDGPDTFYHQATRVGRRAWKAGATNFGQPGRIQPIAICAK